MRQLQQDFGSGEVALTEVPRPRCKAEGVLVKTHQSLVSAGTERAMVDLAQKNLLGKAMERPDLVREVIKKVQHDGLTPTYRSVKARLDEPRPLGYSCAGKVVEVGENVEDFSVGDRVACGGAGYASHAEVNYVPENLCVPIPDGVEMSASAFVTVGAIAMQGVRRLEATPGERIAVLGLGLVGRLAAKILSAYGHPVLGLDIDRAAVDRVKCIDAGAVIGQDDVETAANAFTDGVGVDGVLIAAATDSNDPIELAGDLCREGGTVSIVGDIGMDIPREAYYEKELNVRLSRSYGPGRYDRTYEEQGLDYPIGHVRWTERRNMREFLRLVADGSVTTGDLVTHTFDIADALDAYDLMLEGEEPYVGILIEYPGDVAENTKISLSSGPKRAVDRDTLRVGLVGSGTFATSTLLPVLDDVDAFALHAVATASGESARATGEKYDVAYVTTDYQELIDDPDVDVLVVATRHDIHAEIASEALEADVDVHVEKPLAITESELERVVATERESNARLMVGYNRRFSVAARDLSERFGDAATPVMATYRVNTDRLPDDHWVYDPDEGGGRIVGEVCHFVDFLQAIANAPPTQVYASSPTVDDGSRPDDNVQVLIEFADGSQATLTYTSLGDDSVAKERVEVFGDGTVRTVDNFKRGRLNLRQDKGFAGEFEALADAIRSGDPSPIPIEELVATSRATFAMAESLRSGEAEPVDQDRFLEE
jgi:predicted dehydrogenase/threonine dehydrogenase-like Zn-dependent dehydrogenase